MSIIDDLKWARDNWWKIHGHSVQPVIIAGKAKQIEQIKKFLDSPRQHSKKASRHRQDRAGSISRRPRGG